MDVSSFVLEKIINDLHDVFNSFDFEMSLHVNTDTYSVSICNYNQNDFDSIYYHFMKFSINHSILVYLYSNRKFAIQDLSNFLSLSISSTYRYISQINKNLREFNLTIKNGELKGDSLQISYFYYQFFWYSYPFSYLENMINDFDLVQFIRLLEVKLSITFTQSSKNRILLWCKLIKSNTSKDVPMSNLIVNLIDNFQSDPLYKTIRETYLLSQSYSAILVSDYDIACIYTFLSSAFPADDHFCSITELTPNRWPTYTTEVLNLNTQILELICTHFGLNSEKVLLSIDQNLKYLLSTMHTGVLFFHGRIEDYISAHFLKNLNEIAIHKEILQTLIVRLEVFIGWKLIDTTRQYFFWLYYTLIESILKNNLPNIVIGISLNKTPLLTVPYVDSFKKVYKSKEYILVKQAIPREHYDILVSDSLTNRSDFSFDKYYLIQDIEHDYISPIRDILNKNLRR